MAYVGAGAGGGWGVGLHLEEGGARGRLRETQPRPPGSPCGLLRPIPSISTRESCAVWLNVGSSGAGGNASLGPGRLLCRPTEKSPRGDKAWVWKGGGRDAVLWLLLHKPGCPGHPAFTDPTAPTERQAPCGALSEERNRFYSLTFRLHPPPPCFPHPLSCCSSVSFSGFSSAACSSVGGNGQG